MGPRLPNRGRGIPIPHDLSPPLLELLERSQLPLRHSLQFLLPWPAGPRVPAAFTGVSPRGSHHVPEGQAVLRCPSEPPVPNGVRPQRGDLDGKVQVALAGIGESSQEPVRTIRRSDFELDGRQ